MYIKEIRIDRFGGYSDLALDALSDGLNVVYGPPGSGKTTLARFVRAVLYGFDEATRERYLPVDSRGFGGAVTICGESGCQTISRYDDGSYDGRLNIEHENGTVIGRRHVPEAIAGIHLSTLDRVFAVDYRQRPGISMLIEEARQRGFDLIDGGELGKSATLERTLQEHRDTLATLPRVSDTHEQLRERRATLQQTLSSLEADLACSPQTEDVSEQVARLEKQLADLQVALRPVEQDLAEVERRHREAKARYQHSRRPPDSMIPRLKDLQEVSEQLERWQSVLHEISARRKALKEQAEQISTPSAAAEPRRWLGELETILDDLQSTLAKFDDAANYSGRQVKASTADTLAELRSNVYRLCNDLSCWQTRGQRKDLTRETRRLRRCESELQEAVKDLSKRKRMIQRQLAAAADNEHEALPPWHDALCECAEHPRLRLDAAAHNGAAELAALEAEVVMYRRRQERMTSEISEVQSALQSLRLRPRAVDRAALLERLDAARSELRRVEQDLRDIERRRELLTEIKALEQELQQLRSTKEPSRLPIAASEMLRRLTAGELRKVEVTRESQVWVTDEHGRCRAYHQLGDGSRDLTYLALCLALAEAARGRGLNIPLIVSGAFTHVDAKKVPGAAEVLRDFAKRGHQVLVFTRHEHEAAVFRALGVAVRTLSGNPLHETRWNSVLEGGFPAKKTTAQGDWEGTPQAPLVHDSMGTDRELSRGTYALSEHSPIDEAPSINEADAEQLRQIGVLRVGDLLRLSAGEIAEELQHLGVTQEMVQSWQVQAKLLCRVPNLRPYDARVLAACGVTQPDQLNRLSPGELRATVQKMVDSHKGQSVLLSGTEFELSRLTDWIGTRQAESPTRKEQRPSSNGSHAVRAGSAASTRGPDVLPLKVTDAKERCLLHANDPIVDAPSVGARLAERLNDIGIRTVADLLTADADVVAERLNHRRCSAKVIRQWQQQADLCCRVSQLRGLDARILVALGIGTSGQLAGCDSKELWPRVKEFAGTKEGQRILRDGATPDLSRVAAWIKAAQTALHLDAA